MISVEQDIIIWAGVRKFFVIGKTSKIPSFIIIYYDSSVIFHSQKGRGDMVSRGQVKWFDGPKDSYSSKENGETA